MRKRNLLWGIIGGLFVAAVVAYFIYRKVSGNDDDDGGTGVIMSAECDHLRNTCVAFCLPTDPMCVEDCNNEAEACRANQSTYGLESKIDELRTERARQAHNREVARCRDRCYQNALKIVGVNGEPVDRELTQNTFRDPEFQQLLQDAQACANECGSYIE